LELFEQLEQRNDEVKDLIGGFPGFVSCTAFRSSDGGVTVTVCQDKNGRDESSRRAAEWVNENISAPPASSKQLARRDPPRHSQTGAPRRLAAANARAA